MRENELEEMRALVEELLLQNSKMTLDLRAAIAAGVSPNKALELIRTKGYDALAVRNAEKVLAMVVKELKQ